MESGRTRLIEIYEAFGRASETAQHFEYALSTAWLYLEYFAKGWWQEAPSADEISNLQRTMDKKTLGQLLSNVRGLSWFDATDVTSDDRLSEALDARNILMHEFFKVDSGLMDTDSGRHEKLKQLTHYHEVLDDGLTIVSALVSALTKLRSDLQNSVRREAIIQEGFSNIANAADGDVSKLN